MSKQSDCIPVTNMRYAKNVFAKSIAKKVVELDTPFNADRFGKALFLNAGIYWTW